jgi:hypothetical protein
MRPAQARAVIAHGDIRTGRASVSPARTRRPTTSAGPSVPTPPALTAEQVAEAEYRERMAQSKRELVKKLATQIKSMGIK